MTTSVVDPLVLATVGPVQVLAILGGFSLLLLLVYAVVRVMPKYRDECRDEGWSPACECGDCRWDNACDGGDDR